MPEEQLTKPCPRCGAVLPINFGFPTWCDACGWNLTREMVEPPHNQFAQAWRRLGQRYGQNLLNEAKHFADLRPRLTIQVGLAYLLALLVHAVTLGLVYCAGWLLLLAGAEVGREFLILFLARVFAAVLILLVFWKVRPRFWRSPKSMISRADAPALFRLLDRIAGCLGAPKVTGFALRPDYTADLGQFGFQDDYLVRMGLPLLYALDRQELVAVLAHTLAQSVNGDPQRVWLIASAVGSLQEWHNLFRINQPFYSVRPNTPLQVISAYQIFNFFLALLRILSFFSWLIAKLIALMLYAEMQRAAYRADGLSAQVGGTSAALRALRKQHLEDSYQNILEKARHRMDTRILKEIRERLAEIPEREMERVERIITLHGAGLGSTYPPTRSRIDFLQSRPVEPAQVSLTAAEYTKILAEIAPHELTVEEEIYQMLPRSV